MTINFIGWGECASNPVATIAIQYNSSVVTSWSNLGYYSNAATTIEYGTRSQSSNGKTEVLHEFMHALGFAHEFDSSLNTTNACQPNSGNTAERWGTPYDHNSMTNTTYCHWAIELSPWDIVGLQKAYGRKPSYAMVGYMNLSNLERATPPIGKNGPFVTRNCIRPCI